MLVHAVTAGAIMVALAVAVVVWRAWRTRSARLRLEQMYAAAHHPSRRLVEVLRCLRCTQTGQLLLVIDARTGLEAAVWLPPQALRPGDVALLVWMNGDWVLMDWLRDRRPAAPALGFGFGRLCRRQPRRRLRCAAQMDADRSGQG